jgi:S-adenosyl methyltransferase
MVFEPPRMPRDQNGSELTIHAELLAVSQPPNAQRPVPAPLNRPAVGGVQSGAVSNWHNSSTTPAGSPIIDTNAAHQGRVYDYLAGGTAHFEVDREAARMQAAAYGGEERSRRDIRANRDFIGRAIRYLAGEEGIRQFLDIGTGIPKEDDLHGVAQQTASDARMVFVDNDDVVLAHAHELMKSTPEGIARFVKGDFYDPPAVLQEATQTIDLTRPVALMVVAVLHLHADELHPYETLRTYLDALASGSYLVMTHLSIDIDPDATRGLQRAAEGANVDYGFTLRSKAEFTRFFEGLELVEPGVVPVTSWRTEVDFVAPFWSAVGRKP